MMYRLDLKIPDYLPNENAGYDNVKSFSLYINWLNNTFLERIFMDPFYPEAKVNLENWGYVDVNDTDT